MAKAALEAANGLNIMGINNIDSSLLFVIGFPAFSIDFEKKKIKTSELIENELKGSYGYKRYHLDTLGIPVPENQQNKMKLNKYEDYESEWPIFCVYRAINGIDYL
ncbi:putative phosphorylase b kinase regulatory subunit alpha [Thelohanellus kitauei]|uniref:Phosphorylase b kinase regulatory subunit n=1 Tax=Thelohanellus kitauei TaxID=669202 RepID=A0A0C2NAD2_THEKT|nr:putative phosphorylase b kinase regulatory subunit alpha [Thelohanellus kitauei]